MSLFESIDRQALRRSILFVLLAGAVTACSFSPVHAPSGSNESTLARTQAIFILPPATREEQVIRNELLFAFGQNRGIERNQASYILDLDPNFKSQAAIVSRQGITRASSSVADVEFSLIDAARDKEIYSGRATSRAAFDVFEQQFANERAEIDAENRAARDVAAKIQAQVSGFLATYRR